MIEVLRVVKKIFRSSRPQRVASVVSRHAGSITKKPPVGGSGWSYSGLFNVAGIGGIVVGIELFAVLLSGELAGSVRIGGYLGNDGSIPRPT